MCIGFSAVLYYGIPFQKFDNRAVVVLEGELKHWKQLNVNYMTEESDDPEDSNCIIIHPLPWRSESQWNL